MRTDFLKTGITERQSPTHLAPEEATVIVDGVTLPMFTYATIIHEFWYPKAVIFTYSNSKFIESGSACAHPMPNSPSDHGNVSQLQCD